MQAPIADLTTIGSDRRALGRAISSVEDGDAADLVAAAFAAADGMMVGVTGSPGAGKSSLVDALIAHLRSRQRRVAVVAVDPASPFTGGAILGDRVRMQRHVDDRSVFIRSMSNRGRLGGLAARTAQVTTLVAAAGYDPVLVETVGVGQSEVDVVDLAHVTIVVVAPGFGDGVQAVKAGVLEIADLVVVNKADLTGAEELVRELRAVSDDLPILTTVATTGEGIPEVWATIESVRDTSPEASRRRARRLIDAAVRARLGEIVSARSADPDVIDQVVARSVDPWSIARHLVSTHSG